MPLLCTENAAVVGNESTKPRALAEFEKAERAENSRVRATGKKALQHGNAAAGSSLALPSPEFVLIQLPDEELGTPDPHDLKKVQSMELLREGSKG